ncbi:sulfatase-like hydrolase/transferase [Algoriphagus sp. NG3]|uniref:sulfatase-like hydrolase/transferase n=1 Tax=Algoriphagus sp. NG3 TaxID=3097546 RepID=UPI002A82631D|nr:sulfatase-like hydrolase/transferase [Algoriphagus sp. NG3]WPR73337.1 sulfatase-like hydrolase/transferase [Algoriphagus sp. NG3]
MLPLLIHMYLVSQISVAQDQPNIVWITSEDNSKHYLKLYNEDGVETPNIAKLAETGLVFDYAFSNGPVCSVARSTLISGSYAPRTGAQYHRKIRTVPMPRNLEMFPFYLREAGYYTANNAKEDYNLEKGALVWDESSNSASYKNRKDGQPFFYVHNFQVTHEGQLHFGQEKMKNTPISTLPPSGALQPNHPQTALFQYTKAFYLGRIAEMDRQIGELIDQLKADGLLENTFIFYFGDHGGVLPGSKGYLYETGLHVPLVIHVPERYKDRVSYKTGTRVKEFVSFVDFAPTVLHLAGIKVPNQMDGEPFLSKSQTSNEVAYGYADRFDEKYDFVRSVRKGKYKYIRNFQPFNFDGIYNAYRYKQMAYKEWFDLYRSGKLNQFQRQFFEVKPAEALFDIEKDPYETTNLAKDPVYQKELLVMRKVLENWILSMPDLSFYPEFYLIQEAFENPVEFGQAYKKDIRNYYLTANLATIEFSKAVQKLKRKLDDDDPWVRYWALCALSSFGKEAKSLENAVKKISLDDPFGINRVRANQFLGISGVSNPMENIEEVLYSTTDPNEALLILNILVQLANGPYGYSASVQESRLAPAVANDLNVISRLEYLDGN